MIASLPIVLGLLAAGPRVSANPPVVIMVRSAQSSDGQRREARLFDELGFALDAFQVQSQPAPVPEFASLPLSDQIAAVLPVAHANSAMVVVWMSFPGGRQVMLHVVAIGSGRALIRTIETERSKITEASLALMARELLGTAYLFDPPGTVPAEVTEVVRGVKEKIPPDVGAPKPLDDKWSVWGQLRSAYPITGGLDAVPVVAIEMNLERRLPLGIDLSAGVEAEASAVARPDVGGARWLSAGLSAALFRGFPAGGLSAGPFGAVFLDYGSFRAPGGSTGFALPGMRVGAQVRSPDRAGAGLGVALSLDLFPVRAELQAPDGSPLYRTPSASLSLALVGGWRGL